VENIPKYGTSSATRPHAFNLLGLVQKTHVRLGTRAATACPNNGPSLATRWPLKHWAVFSLLDHLDPIMFYRYNLNVQ
jgi:hypothetical protein